VSGKIRRRQGVDEDVAKIALFLLDQSESLADRFITSVQTTMKDVAQSPGIGSLKDYGNPLLGGVRSWWIRGFRNHLMYYLVTDDGIDVLAVAHGAQDVETLLQGRV
jgi:toxin ParE1/3/4